MMNSDSNPTSLSIETQYLPPISVFVRMQSFSQISIDVEENFRKSTWRNRCTIINPNGTLLLTVPVIGGRGVRSKSKDVRVANDQPWQRIHWRSIVAAYGKSSFFIFYEEKFRRMYEKQFEFLIDFNTSLLRLCFEILRWEKDIILHNPNKYPSMETEESKIPDKKIGAGIEYHQVFESRHGFIPDVSIADLLFNSGTGANEYLESLNRTVKDV